MFYLPQVHVRAGDRQQMPTQPGHQPATEPHDRAPRSRAAAALSRAPGRASGGRPSSPPGGRSLRARLARALFGSVIQDLAATSPVSVRIADDAGWTPLHTPGPHDRDFSEWLHDQNDALEAWRKNFLVRRIVTLTRSYVLGGGITLSSGHRYVQSFTKEFTEHPKNDLYNRLGAICDELTRAGEIFPILFTNRVDGMSYLRFLPASQIHSIQTDPEDYETELAYYESTAGCAPEGKRWLAAGNPDAWNPDTATGSLPPVMLHYIVAARQIALDFLTHLFPVNIFLLEILIRLFQVDLQFLKNTNRQILLFDLKLTQFQFKFVDLLFNVALTHALGAKVFFVLLFLRMQLF